MATAGKPLSSLEGYISISYLSQSVVGGALESYYILLSYPIIALASHITMVLKSTLKHPSICTEEAD